MQTFRVAAVSMNSELGKHKQTMQRLADFCELAAVEHAKLVLFPELVIHGHCNPDTWKVAEDVPNGPSVARLVELAQQFKLFLSAGISEKEKDIVFNTQVLVGPSGYIGKQRKLHMSRDESFYYKGGREIAVFDIGKCRLGMAICFDNQFPEIPRILALKGADVILMPHAAREGKWVDTPESAAVARRKMFELASTKCSVRAQENACFCVYADQAGRAGYVDSLPRDHYNQPHHPGGAMIIGPDGQILIHTQTEQIHDEMVVHDLDAEMLGKVRAHPNYPLRVRRNDLFGELVREQILS